MAYISAKDGTEIYFKDWGTGPTIFFSHGWPLNSDAWEDQMLALSALGYRCIAHDRRGHGRSDQPWTGNDMNTFAEDIATIFDMLELDGVTVVGHSMGGGDIARYIGRYGTGRLSKAVLISAVPPYLLKTDDNPEGVAVDVFDEMREGIVSDRGRFFEDIAKKFFNANALLSGVPHTMLRAFEVRAMQASIKSVFDSVTAFSETDFRDDLAKFNIPTLVLHGSADQLVPLAVSSQRTVGLLPSGVLNVYDGASHGLCQTHKDLVNSDISEFIRSAGFAQL